MELNKNFILLRKEGCFGKMNHEGKSVALSHNAK